jgi:hypothetical protein
LFWSFLARKNHFGKTLADGAVMIDFGEAQIFVRQLAQPLDGGIDLDRAGLHRFEKFPNFAFIHLEYSPRASQAGAFGF